MSALTQLFGADDTMWTAASEGSCCHRNVSRPSNARQCALVNTDRAAGTVHAMQLKNSAAGMYCRRASAALTTAAHSPTLLQANRT